MPYYRKRYVSWCVRVNHQRHPDFGLLDESTVLAQRFQRFARKITPTQNCQRQIFRKPRIRCHADKLLRRSVVNQRFNPRIGRE